MKRPNDWDTVKPYEERKAITPGGYVCEVKHVEETFNKNGGEMIVVKFDVAEGEFKGYFFDEFTNKKSNDVNAKWPYQGTKWINVVGFNGGTNRTLKAFVNAVEAENVRIDNGRELVFARAKGAKIGVVFRDEEAESMTGGTYWRAVPNYFCTAEDIRTGNFRVPKKIELKQEQSKPAPASAEPFGFAETNEEIPF